MYNIYNNINQKNQSNFLIKNGWIKIKLNNSKGSSLIYARDEILNYLQKKFLPNIKNLESYHKFVNSDEFHFEIQSELSDFFRSQKFSYHIVNENLHNIMPFIGCDLMIQKNPYMRIARPGKAIDNIGFHRDTSYGSSPYEISISIPLSNISKLGSLQVVSSSHIWADSILGSFKVQSKRVKKNSKLHNIGFPYSPMIISDSVIKMAKPVHTRFGEALLFSLSLVHGQEINKSLSTRFQTDVRVVNSFSSFNTSRSVDSEYYEDLISSPVTINADAFRKNNQSVMNNL